MAIIFVFRSVNAQVLLSNGMLLLLLAILALAVIYLYLQLSATRRQAQRDVYLQREEAQLQKANATRWEQAKQEAERRSLQYEQRWEQNQQQLIQLQSTLAQRNSEIGFLQQRIEEQQNQQEQLQTQFSRHFEVLAQKILEEKSQKFSSHNEQQLRQLLQPFSENLQHLEARLRAAQLEDTQQRSALVTQIQQLAELNRNLGDEAHKLTRALKGDQKTQGNWGELVLERLLEKAGLVRGREYNVQEMFSDNEGLRRQPDVILYLPENKHIIIDAKVSLTAFERYASAENAQEQKTHLQEHIASLRRHVASLSSKNYQQIYQLQSLDFVLLFVAIEPAFAAAVQHDAALFQEAFERNVLIVSPTTLLATARTIASIWRQEQQTRHALEIARQSGLMYDKFVAFVEDLEKVGKNLQTAHDSYEQALKKLRDGKGNLLRRAEQLRELGAKNSKLLPNQYFDEEEG